MAVTQRDLHQLTQSASEGLILVLEYDEETQVYFVSFSIMSIDEEGIVKYGNVQPLFTQRKTRKYFKDIRRALDWARSNGFRRVRFEHEWSDWNPRF